MSAPPLPRNARVLEAFVFAVFLAPGVAPFVISNPMNMIVAEYAGIGFNQYAVVMAKARIVGDHPRETFADG